MKTSKRVQVSARLLKTAGYVFVAAVFGLGVVAVRASVFAPPACGPDSHEWPDCNTPPPLNVSGVPQTKIGDLNIINDSGTNNLRADQLHVVGPAIINEGDLGRGIGFSNTALIIPSGKVGIGTMNPQGTLLDVEGGDVQIGATNAYPSRLVIGTSSGNFTDLNRGRLTVYGNIGALTDDNHGLLIANGVIQESSGSTPGFPYQGDLSILPGASGSGNSNLLTNDDLGNLYLKPDSNRGVVSIGENGLVNLIENGNIILQSRPHTFDVYLRVPGAAGESYDLTKPIRNETEAATRSMWPATWWDYKLKCDQSPTSSDSGCQGGLFPPLVNGPFGEGAGYTNAGYKYDRKLWASSATNCFPVDFTKTSCNYYAAVDIYQKSDVTLGAEGGNIQGNEGWFNGFNMNTANVYGQLTAGPLGDPSASYLNGHSGAGQIEGDLSVGGNIYGAKNITATGNIIGKQLCIGGDGPGQCQPSWPSSGLSGSGTNGVIPMWTGSSALGTSNLTQSGGNFNVAGSLTATGGVGASMFCLTNSGCADSWQKAVQLGGGNNGNGNGGKQSQWTTSGNDIYYDVNGGNVGVHTAQPTAALHVGSLTSVDLTRGIFNEFQVDDSHGNAAMKISWDGASYFGGTVSADEFWVGQQLFIQSLHSSDPGDAWVADNADGALTFSPLSKIPLANRKFVLAGFGVQLCLGGNTPQNCRSSWPAATGGSQWTTGSNGISYSGGNVGIGTTSNPSYTLQVNGGIQGNNIYAGNSLCIQGVCASSWADAVKQGGGGGLGTWLPFQYHPTDPIGGLSAGNIQANTDLFVMVTYLSNRSDLDACSLSILSDSSFNPMTVRAQMNSPVFQHASQGYSTLLSPVKKGDYWRIKYANCNNPTSIKVSYIPFGS